MTSSRSNSWFVALAVLVLWIGTADAGRRRVVVLDFDGPKAEKFHADVVKLLKKSHTVVSVEKWNAAAEELDAGKVTEKNVKKLAKKLKVDGVVTGKIEKRRDEYIIRLKLRAGTTGEIIGTSVQTKAEGPRLDGQAQRDIKEELIGAIEELESNRGGGDEEDEEAEDRPAKKKKKPAEDEEEEEEAPRKSGFARKSDDEEEVEDRPSKKKTAKVEDAEIEEDRPAKKKKGARAEEDEKPAKKKKGADEEIAMDEEEDTPLPKTKKRPKSADEEDTETAAADEDDPSVEEEVEVEGDRELNVSPGRRAIDAVVGLSFTARRLAFTYAADLGKAPPGYKQAVPVPGALIDVTAYPLSFGHKRKDLLAGIGVTVLYDKVLVINSRKRYSDGMGMPQIANLETEESRWAFGAVFRYPLGQSAKAPVVGGSLTYGRQRFNVAQVLPNNEKTDIPNVHYTMITPTAFLRLPVIPKVTFNLDAGFLGILDTGAIQKPDQYGAASVTGFEFDLGVDYMVTNGLFARAGVRVQTIGFKFKGDPMSQTHTRDTDPEQDVTGARDTYFGGAATVGYLY